MFNKSAKKKKNYIRIVTFALSNIIYKTNSILLNFGFHEVNFGQENLLNSFSEKIV